jgi:NADH:ubiquinone oxidoreductase subunit H
MVGSLLPDAIVAAQSGYLLGVSPHWFVLTPWGAVAFVLFFISALVESNRTPFDVPEGESEIVAGHMTEYSGFKYAIFFLGEYLGMFAVRVDDDILRLAGTVVFPVNRGILVFCETERDFFTVRAGPRGQVIKDRRNSVLPMAFADPYASGSSVVDGWLIR